MRLIQFETTNGTRAVGVVSPEGIAQLNDVTSTRDLALEAIGRKQTIAERVAALGTGEIHDYDALLSSGRVLAPLDHPDAAHCVIAGTGLTHIGSAASRSKMHTATADADEAELNDSMKMFKWGVDGGKPGNGAPGVQPEWFYKGDGSIVARPGEDFPVPDFADDEGEEPEVVGLYVIGDDGRPYRVGFAIGNEATDHVMEKKNYLYLAHAKLRHCSFGPELRVGELPSHVEGTVRIRRNGAVVWEKPFPTGEDNMSHSIANLEYHHFKYNQFLRPGDVHVQFLGTSVASFGDGIKTEDGDVFEIEIPEFGRPLINGTRRVQETLKMGSIQAL
ncbi:MAG: FAH family protein [Hoeflea sp.]|uniref:AraD1 family protein n=1 Tax=Hoeflea sp. TaxID=1940281 RepID=UPI001D9D50E7|nr:AraD1 family protein [Hoeflea sp.]MBU4531171.1 FAH family protein [Alphaproteobacteria bacterium]MBU4545767.1 FAH family protein [Alphaproteobacteria bacterium]MBU4550736.1 FAH family protein [Alphaproteobacteria bacterium]MBV1724448.1 FAH family protein [Hoeflea sp.]MBV1760468.1 FAH family protein [Hoeflea sp.]